MTDPNTPTQSSNNPQDLIDQALGSSSLTPTPAAEIPKEEVAANSEQSLPTPEPLSQASSQTVEPSIAEASTPLSTATDTVPAELTNTQTEPTVLPEPPKETKPMGEDMPLAFVGAAANMGNDVNISASAPVVVEPVNNTVPPSLNTTPSAPIKTKKKSKVFAMVAGFFLLFVTIGTVAYNALGDPITIAGVTIGKNGRPSEIDNKEDCDGESNGGWLVWRNGSCKVTGSSGSEDKNNDGVGDKDTVNPNLQIDANNLKNEGSCEGAGKGYVWCESVDSAGKSYAFCNTGGKGCNQAAIDKGYTIQIGKVECAQAPNGQWLPTIETVNSISGASTSNETKIQQLEAVKNQCSANAGSFTGSGNKEMWLCPKGTTVACTANVPGAKRYYGNPAGCFCGVIQVDTGSGHTSYSSTCGCDKDNPEPSTPTITTNPTLMCSSLTRTPTTTPAVGDKVTFTCVGASTPAGAVSLTYKFRYSLNSGAYVAMTNKTATTSELTIASCGSYKVQCQACGTINGVLTCDPNWTAATQ